ncbi:MAG: hypothetical protein Q7J32_17535 [Sphingomonadaceae bacterium]|nr:hypothetical protein [Sphingomonadaceae bacterium]
MHDQHGAYILQPLPLASVLPRRWYFALDCKSCGEPFAVFSDNSGGRRTVPLEGDGVMFCECGHCGGGWHYLASDLRSYRPKAPPLRVVR